MSQITEWEFTGDVQSQINQILNERSDLPFSEAKTEQRGTGSTKRRDITLLDRTTKRAVFTGEIKMPDKRDGKTPLNEVVVIDAHNKANAIGVKHFFTWNVNNCVLWNTFEEGKSITERHVEFIKALPAPIVKSDELLQPRIKEQVKSFLEKLLDRCAAILSGEKPLAKLPLDETFIRVWELALMPIVQETLFAINSKYNSDLSFKKSFEKWMREEQGWTLSNEEEIIRENLERSAKFSSYVLANKIVFYKALQRQFPKLNKLEITDKVTTKGKLKEVLETAFRHATEITLDYETVFQSDFGDSLPLLNDDSVESWRELLEDTSKFDFTELPYEVLGHIFENLLSPEERHKYGQHYTRSEIVDLINAFCIRKADAKVLDPSCGGGTFLVRAYQRKKDLSDSTLSHQELIGQIHGTDVSAYPVHLTTINLATRDLKEGANYPLVARRDFLKTKLNTKIFNVPNPSGDNLLPLLKLDAIVGNPPYIEQTKINEYYGKNYKNLIQQTARNDAPNNELSSKSDIFCYFFTHSFALLEDDGYIGFLTSSNWLDTLYGFDLQKFLLENFEIIAIIESNREPWFTGARVTTAATILRKQPDAKKRNTNNVKFVWLKKPISDFVAYSKNDEDARRATFEDIRQRIEHLTKEEENETWRIRVINQADLFQAGCLSFEVQAEEEDEEENPKSTSQQSTVKVTQNNFLGVPEQPSLQIASDNPKAKSHNLHSEYKGYKWGIFLRAPEIFSKLLKLGGSRFVPLGQISELKRGVTSGCDAFFFPKDITDEKLAENLTDKEFKDRYGITKKEAKEVRIVHAGDKSQHLIEAKYLEGEIHSLMGIDSIEINEKDLSKKVLLINLPKEKIKGTKVLKYIQYGEQEKFNERTTVAARTSSERLWYDITDSVRKEIILPKIQQYRHIISRNAQRLICSSSLMALSGNNGSSDLLCAILNSTIVALFKQFFGRIHGAEGSLQLDVYSAQMMFVPNPHDATPEISKKIISAFSSMRNRKALPLVDVDSTDKENWTGELALADRQTLDDAVLELLGITDANKRKELQEELYREITELYREIRVKEKETQKNRSKTARKGKQTAHSIAEEIWTELSPQPKPFTPLDFVPAKAEIETFTLPLGRARVVAKSLLHTDGVQIGNDFIELGSEARSNFVKSLSDLAIHGEIDIPNSPQTCEKALSNFEKQFEKINEIFHSEAVTFTADEDMQEKVIKELWRLVRKQL